MEFTVHEAKTHFSKLLAQVQAGEEVIITSGRARKPIAKVTGIETSPKNRIGFAPDWPKPEAAFFEPLPEDELAFFNGEEP